MTTFERVKNIAKKRGISLTELSVKAGMGEKSIYRWKENQPTGDKVKSVAEILGVSTDYLLGATDDTKPAYVEDAPIDLDSALEDEGMVMFDGQPLSEEYKRALLAMLRANRGQ